MEVICVTDLAGAEVAYLVRYCLAELFWAETQPDKTVIGGSTIQGRPAIFLAYNTPHLCRETGQNGTQTVFSNCVKVIHFWVTYHMMTLGGYNRGRVGKKTRGIRRNPRTGL